jgi:D-alanine-D-alanine ligase
MLDKKGASPRVVGVIFGGTGPEHGVSCLSARSIVMALESRGYMVYSFGIAQSGQWVLVANSTVSDYVITGSRLPCVKLTNQLVTLSLDPREPGFHVNGEFISCSVAFPVVHGIGGEDGSLQGLLESAGISYVGSGVEASAVAMNKVTSKRIARSLGIETGNWVSAGIAGLVEFESELLESLNGKPLFIKPVSGGSSAGISRVTDPGRLRGAFDMATAISEQIIIEEAIDSPREIEVAILETADGVKASLTGEVRVREEFEFYNFEAKYLDDGAELITPAQMDFDLSERIRKLAIEIFVGIGCRDYARVDFFLDSQARIIFNEINTIPGFTSISMYSRMWAAGGIEFSELVDQLLGNAFARSTRMLEAGS